MNPLKAKRTPAAEIRRRIIELSREDNTQVDIARTVHKSQPYVSMVLKAYRDELNQQSIEDTRVMVLEMEQRYLRVLAAHAGNIQDPDSANIYLKACAQMAKLRGLNEETSQTNVQINTMVPITFNVSEEDPQYDPA